MNQLFSKLLVLLLLTFTCTGCAFMIAKETAKAVDVILEDDPNPEKKEKILKKENNILSNQRKLQEKQEPIEKQNERRLYNKDFLNHTFWV